jgi:PAS domain S-box-containing protein
MSPAPELPPEGRGAQSSSAGSLEPIIDAVPDIVFTQLPDGRIESLNKRFEDILGYDRADWIGRPFAPLVHPDDLAALAERNRAVLEGKDGGLRTLRVRRKDGAWVLIETTIRAEFADGRPVRLVGMARDVTNLREAEAKIEQSRRELQEILDSIRSFTAKIGVDGRVLVVGRAAQEASGFTLEQLHGMNFLEGPWFAFDPAVHAKAKDAFARAAAGEMVEYDTPIRLFAAGRPVDAIVSLSFVPLRGPDGKVLHVVGEARDITALKQSEAEFAERAQLVDLAFDAVIVRAMDGKIYLWNEGAERIYGWTQEQAKGRPVHRLLGTGFPEPLVDITEKARRDGLWEGALSQRTKDGRSIVVESRWVYRPAGALPEAILEVNHDVTARRSLEARYRHMVESIKDYEILLLDAEGRIASWNEGAARIHGWKENEIVGQTYDRLFLPEDSAQGRPGEILWTAAVEGRFESQGWRVRKDGTKFFVDSIVTALRGPDGTLQGFVKVTRDITERRRAEMELRSSEERFRLLVDNIRDYAIYSLDPEGRILTWNRSAERLYGYLAEEALGQPVSIFYPEAEIRQGRPAEALRIAAEEGRREELGWRLRKDGTRFWANVLTAGIRSPDGKLLGYARVVRDETERKRAEEALNKKTAELERSNRELESFGYAASHDLQEPLRKMASFAQLLAKRFEGQVDPEARQYVDRMVDGAARMQELIDNLLSYSRVGRDAPLEAVELEEPLLAALANLEQSIKETGAKIEYDALPRVLGNKQRLAQLLQNLLSNAIKFRGTGAPKVRLSAKRKGADWEIAVKDHGIGIEPKNHERVFELFKRLHSRTQYPGTGIGLALCKKIVELHGGRIWVESKLGKGSAFYFTLKPALPTLSPEIPLELP